MNTPVNFELAKLIKEKGFESKSHIAEYWNVEEKQLLVETWEDEYDSFHHEDCPHDITFVCSAPTITEVVYWIYSKYDIWISLIPDSSSGHKLLDRKFSVSIFRFNMNLNVQAEILRKDKNILYFNLPENAFEYAIEYTLKNLIK